MAGSLDGAAFSRVSSHHCSSSEKPRIPPYQGMNSHLAHTTCCSKRRTAVPAGGSPMPSVTAVSQGLCSKPAHSHLWKPLVNQRPLVWKVLPICRWKWIVMPREFPGNCPYWLIDLLMSFFPCLKGAGKKRARPGWLWHRARAVKTNLTFSPPESPCYIPYLEHWFIQCYFLLC